MQYQQTAFTFKGVEFVRTEFAQEPGDEFPHVEIEPADDMLPILVTRISQRGYVVEWWRDYQCQRYIGSREAIYFASRPVMSEEAAIKKALAKVNRLRLR